MTGVFLFLVQPSDDPITGGLPTEFGAAAAHPELPPLRWASEGNYAVALGPDSAGLGTGPFLARSRRLVVVGNARLDNRDELARWTGQPDRLADATDLEIVAGAVEARGPGCIPGILGDFGFVVWNPAIRELLAARDAFGVKTLYYTERRGLVAFSSRASVLARQERYDRDYLLDYLLGSPPARERTAFIDVLPVPPGSTVARKRGSTEVRRFWSPCDFPVDDSLDHEDAVDRFRALFARAVSCRLTGRTDVWAELSGGLDSSSIVSVAQARRAASRVRAGVAGTVTAVDSLGAGDETAYVAAVLASHPTRNERVCDYWMWRDDGSPPPRVDHPYAAYPMFARDRRMNALVRAGGGRALMSGEGPDHYLTGSLHFVADWIARGRVDAAVRELARWSGTLRTSFARLAVRYGISPFVPASIRRRSLVQNRFPAWLTVTRAERRDLVERLPEMHWQAVGTGSWYERWVAYSIDQIASVLERPVISESLEMRFPFLYRPLVELSLSLPAAMRSQPHARKWVLRQAMRGTLPESVRLRTGKGGIGGRTVWSLQRERERITSLLADPVLGGTGLVDVTELRSAVAGAIEGRGEATLRVMPALTLETWLCVRSGRWPSPSPKQDPKHPSEQLRSRPVVHP